MVLVAIQQQSVLLGFIGKAAYEVRVFGRGAHAT